jgi:hypothetical protein
VSFLRILSDQEYRERMDCAVRIRADRTRRDSARARGDVSGANFYQFAAKVTRDSRLLTYTRSKTPLPVATPSRGNATGQG